MPQSVGAGEMPALDAHMLKTEELPVESTPEISGEVQAETSLSLPGMDMASDVSGSDEHNLEHEDDHPSPEHIEEEGTAALFPGLPEETPSVENRDMSIEGYQTATEEEKSVEALPVQTIDSSQSNVVLQKTQQVRKRPGWRYKVIALSLILFLLAGIIVPVAIMIHIALNAYATYQHVHDRAYSGYHHFLNLKPLVATMEAHPTTAINAANLAQAEKELTAARSDFTQVQTLLTYTPDMQTITAYFPQYRIQIATVQSASKIGIDAATIGLQLTGLGLNLSSLLQSPLLSNASTPLITDQELTQIRSTLDTIRPLLNDIQARSHDLSLTTLPISQSQILQFSNYLSLLPQLQSALVQSDGLLNAAGWLLGVDGPRTLLVQPMDRAELRATGGFTGQYGELTIHQGRIEPFSMRNIALLEYNNDSYAMGRSAPSAYRSWWPFANWGLRDSNLSADFPTSAKMAIDLYKKEAGRSVDGVVMVTPFAIEDVLKIVGPLHIATYNETITAQNLEDRLHYYQLGPGIAKEKTITHLANDDEARKQFTSELARVLMDAVRHEPSETLLQIGKQLLYDLQTRDLQVYVTNPQIEEMLVQHGDAGLLDRSTSHDGLYIVQSNVSASKASQYVRTIVHDSIQLDQRGGATHSLQLQLIYQQTGPVYGLDTYRDYIRFYVPPGSVLRAGDGFDSGQALCGGNLFPCAADHVYPQNELVCPSGQYDAGYAAPMLDDPYVGRDHPLDVVGKPTNLQSDEPGRAMFAGYVVIPKNCTATVTLSWYVPPLGNAAYQLLIQRQAGTYPEYHLTITSPVPAQCAGATLTRDAVLQEDMFVLLGKLMTGSRGVRACATFLFP
ncbi:MAG TPA: DUF4012 domain-containing protein [Ktedonobacteraceae bacterium]|nr:DUF4012 domain-containing protein [Ktedonobacteraceae bacterium]